MKSLIIIICCLIAIDGSAQKVSFTKASERHLDTHIVAEGETWYSISKHYGTNVDELLKINPSLNKNSLTAGSLINVPIAKQTATEASQKTAAENKFDSAVKYKAEKGETAYSISKKNNITIDQLKSWNNLTSTDIKVGQVLIVGYKETSMNLIGPLPMEESWATAAGIKDNEANAKSEKGLPQTVASPKINSGITNEVLMKHDEKGIATWTHSTYDEGNYYALHPTAPKGTIITVLNLMNNKTVTVKVIGKLPSTSENENVQIKISESAAKKLNVLDDKFLVKLEYMAPEEIVATGNN